MDSLLHEKETALTQSEMIISQNYRPPNDFGGVRDKKGRRISPPSVVVVLIAAKIARRLE
jgi:hypothetical protein